MNAVELMVGDWADYGIGDSSYIMHTSPREIFECSECRPIPITPEILEKNGFKIHPARIEEEVLKFGDFEVMYDKGLAQVQISRWDSRFGTASYFQTFMAFDVLYVHQLQQALRLIGCKKEIEL